MDAVICGDLEQKLMRLDAMANDYQEQGQIEEVIELRIQQLSLSKVMVNIHRKSNFMLVTSHSQLGEAYLNMKWFDQALDHLTQALKLNANLLNEVEETKDYHTHLLTMLGRCYLEAGNFRDSEALLDKALTLAEQISGQASLQTGPILQLLSKLYI